VKMRIIEKFLKDVQKHIKKKVKKEVIETPLSDAHHIVGT